METKSKLTDEQVDALWDEYFRERDIETQNALLTHYLYLVVGIVKRIMPQYKGYCDMNDLISDGVLGLIDAVTKYDRSFETKFQTYAAIRIKGAVLDHLRKQDWASSTLRKKLTVIQRVSDEYEAVNGRVPTEREIAERTDMSESEVADALQTSQMFNIVSFESLLYEKEYDETTGGIKSDPYSDVERRETFKSMNEALGILGEKERLVITLHYYEGMTMKSIAKILDVTESRVSQIHSKALLRMRKVMEAG